jgi:outer membrane receptor protein involved in Fe transport
MALQLRVLLVVSCVLSAVAAGAQPGSTYLGRAVQSVIDELRAAGSPLVYSSNLLPPTLRVESEPTSTAPLALAREVLAPHGLTVRDEAGIWLVVRGEPPVPAPALPARLILTVQGAYSGLPISAGTVQMDAPTGPVVAVADGRAEITDIAPGRHSLTVRGQGFLPERLTVSATAGAEIAVTVALFEAVAKLDEITVVASRYDVTNEIQPSAAYFSRDEIEALASVGDDTVRVAHRLPGVASNDFSARPYVRGGATNEFAVLLDGVRLIEPYHLRDFQGMVSAVDQRIVDTAAIHAGGFPAEYGDVLSGLMVVEPREPTELAHEIGLSVLYTSLLSSGTFAGERASWLISARNSNLDRVVADDIGEPSYSDVFVRVGADLGNKHRLTFGGLEFRDDLVFTPKDTAPDREEAASDTYNEQLWLKLESVWSEQLSSDTWLYSTRFESSRKESVADLDEIVGIVDDHRELDLLGLKQAWRYGQSDRQLLAFGFDVEQSDATYRYSSAVTRLGVLASLGGTAPPLRDLEVAPSGRSFAAYVSDRVRATEKLILDLGVRWERQDYLPADFDEQWSPRAGLLYRLGERTDLRMSYGSFFQPEGLLDLQVEDGVVDFSRAQDASHSIISLERRLVGTLAMRAEYYRKRTRHARPRYENQFDPLVLVPELRASRVRIAPEQAEARGLELLLSGEQPVSWWVGLSFARVVDDIDGVSVPRSWDQENALSAGVIWRVGSWDLSGAASLNRGWPVTEVTVTTLPSGEVVAQAGQRNDTRLPSVRRLDFRASKDFMVGSGALRFFAEVANLTDRENPCCLVFDPVTLPDGSPGLERTERARFGATGNVGLLWQF